MFKFLKDKLKKGIESISKRIKGEEAIKELDAEEKRAEADEIGEGVVEERVVEGGQKEDKGHIEEEQYIEAKKDEIKDEVEAEDEAGEEVPGEDRQEDRKGGEEQAEEEKQPEEEKQLKEKKQPEKKEDMPEPEKKKGFFRKITSSLTEKITTTKIDREKFEEMFYELEIGLMENNVAVEVIEKIKGDLEEKLVDKPLRRLKVEGTIREALRDSISEVLDVPAFELVGRVKEKKPFVVCFVGINGSGKTTTIAKIAYMLKGNGLNVVLAAGDTFRAASIEQLQKHADNIGVKLIRHDYGSDPAAVAFDAIKHAQTKNFDAVLIDTAGRMHSNTNLMAELGKVKRVAKPDLIIFVGEALTGNDCVEQVRMFDEAVGIDGIILTKADVDEKGGAMISASYVSKKPLLYLGVGQGYSALERFDSGKILERLEI